jgi:hypothetical protein
MRCLARPDEALANPRAACNTRRSMRNVGWFAALLVGAVACQGTSVTRGEDVSAAVRGLPGEGLRKVAGKRIYFGHQSVGYNLVDGLQAIARERPELGLKVVEARSPEALQGPVFAHASNGRNHEPLSKIQDFAATLDAGLGARADVALFKFCYVDFEPGTDVDAVFAEYRSTLARLRQAYPRVQFVHVTSPLTVVQTGPKALVKRLLGRPLWGADANIVRERFNGLMRREYAGKEPLFDLAAVEASRPNGPGATFEAAGGTHPALAAEYASDGKHLNDVGARWAALHLLQTLAGLPD